MAGAQADRRLCAKGLVLLLLLVGAEALRADDNIKFAMNSNRVEGPEQDWTTENDKCEWHIMKWGCGPTTTGTLAEGSCQKRCMPLDVTWSSCCRLSDDYMLQNERAKYFQIASGVLAAKATKFKDECKGLSFYQMHTSRRCARRASHLMRSIEFMGKAQDDKLIAAMSDEEQAEQQRLFDESLGAMSEAIGEEGPAIMQLQAKMKGNVGGIREDPKGSILKIMSLVQQVLRGTEVEKQQAMEEIDAMPDNIEAATGDEKNEQDTKLANLANILEQEKEGVANVIDAANYIDSTEASEDLDEVLDPELEGALEKETGSLVEQGLQVQVANGFIAAVGLVVIVILIIAAVLWLAAGVIIALVGWALLSILGCGLYSLGHNHALDSVKEGGGEAGKVQRRGVGTTLMCIGKVFAAPFIFIGTAVYAAYKLIFVHPVHSERASDGHMLLELDGGNKSRIRSYGNSSGLLALTKGARKHAQTLMIEGPK